MRPSDEAWVITDIDEPFRIHHVSPAWERLSGWELSEALGKPCFTLMHGDMSDSYQLQLVKEQVAIQGRVKLDLLSYHRNGTAFRNTLAISPLVGPSGGVTHLLGVVKKSIDM